MAHTVRLQECAYGEGRRGQVGYLARKYPYNDALYLIPVIIVEVFPRGYPACASSGEKGPEMVLDEKRLHVQALNHCFHLGLGWPLLEAAGGVENLWQYVDVANRVQEDARALQNPVDSAVDVLLIFQGSVPRAVCVGASHPGPVGDRLDCLHGDVTLLAGGDQGVEVLGVIGILHAEIVIGQQHRIKVEATQAAAMRGCNLRAMTGYADGTNESLLFCLDSSLQCTTGAEGDIPFDRIDQIMQLPEVHVIHAHALK